MRKKSLIFLASCALTLAACSYNPFNEFTGIEFSFSGTGGLEVSQCLDKLVWANNDKCSFYEIYVESSSTSSSKSSSKSSSSKSAEQLPYKTVYDCGFTYDSSLLNKKIKIVGCTYDENLEKKIVCKSNTITLPTSLPSFEINSAAKLTINQSTVSKHQQSVSGIVNVASSITYLEIGNFNDALLSFDFASRPDGSVVRIKMTDSKFHSHDDGVQPAFNYMGTNKNVSFIFMLNGENSVTGSNSTTYKYAASDGLKLPNVYFYGGDGSLTINGGSCSSFSSSYENNNAGYAVSANKMVNCLGSAAIRLIGGNGGTGIKYTRGGHGQMPIKEGTKVLATYSSSIGLQAGNGGQGGYGAYGGNAYAYSYLVDVAYKNYKKSFYKIKEASPGPGGTSGGTGSYITK